MSQRRSLHHNIRLSRLQGPYEKIGGAPVGSHLLHFSIWIDFENDRRLDATLNVTCPVDNRV